MIIENPNIPFRSILTIYTKHREQLLSTLRYKRYQRDETSEQFARLLGPDVVLGSHPWVVFADARGFIKLQNNQPDQPHRLNTTEQRDLLIAPPIHDLGELEVGDITYDQHTNDHKQKERLHFRALTAEFPEKEMLWQVFDNVVLDQSSKLGRMFSAIEKFGYLNTALMAYRGVDGERIENWYGLVGNVFSNQIEELLIFSQNYPLIRQQLEQNSPNITQSFEEVSCKKVEFDNAGKPFYKTENFNKAKLAWSQSKFKRN